MDVSIIIVNWNTKELLEDCLTSIYKFTRDLTFEVTVVDNASTDGSQAFVKQKFPQTKLIVNKDNLGFAKANNIGIKSAKGDHVLLLNSDTYLIENSVKKLFDKAGMIKHPGVIAPKILNTDKSTQQSVGFFPNIPQIFYWVSFIDDLPFGQYLKPYHVDHDNFYQKEHEVDWATGAALFIPRQIIEEVGDLDSKIFMYGEDVEWCYRIKKSGHKIIYSPISKIIHIGRGSSNKVSKNAFVGEFEGIKYFYKKYRPDSLQLVRMLLKIGALARIIIFGILGRKDLATAYVEAFKVA